MDTQDTTAIVTGSNAASGATASSSADSAHGAQTAATTEKPNVFQDLLNRLGDHHQVSFEPIGTLPLPYFFWDKDGFHTFSSEEAVKQSNTYTVKEAEGPLTQKGAVMRKDGGPIAFDMSVTSNMFFMLVASIILFIVLRRAAAKSKKSLVPTGITNLVEVLIVFTRDEIVYPNVELPWGERLMPFFLSVFFFIMTINLLGLVPWGHTATSAVSITAGLAIVTFFVTQVVGIKSMGLKTYLLHFTGGLHEMELGIGLKIALMLIMIPIEIMGLFTKPFALAVRLFANMTAGHIVIFSLIGLAFLFHSWAVGAFVSVPFALFIFLLEIFVALLQAYIFTILSAVFIGFMAHTPHEEHEEDHDLHHVNGDHLIATSHSV